MKKAMWLLAAGIILLAGCSTKTEKNEAEQPLKIGVLSTADSLALFAAEQDGLYEKYGVEVALVKFASAPDQSKAVEAGEVDAVMTDLVVQSLINKGDSDLKVVSIALGDKPDRGKFMVVASNASPVANQQTLEGAKVAISEGTMMEFLLDSYCEELGMDVSKVQKVSVPSLSLRLEMLLEGKDIDCALLPEPLGDFAVMKGGTPIVDDTKLSTNLSQSVIAVEGSYIKEHKEYVQKFVDAYTEAAEKINSKPEEYRELVMQVANIPEAMRDTYQIPVYSVGQVTDEQLLDRVQDWMVKKGLLEKKGSYEELVDTSFIK